MKALAFLIGITLILLLSGCNGCSSNSGSTTSYLDESPEYSDDAKYSEVITTAIEDSSIRISYTEMHGNTITIPVKINGMTLDMIFDTGASSTCITRAEAQYLYEKGTLTENDIVDVQQFQTADGNITVGLRIVLRDITIGDKISLHNIEAIVVQNQQAPLLLGQSVMKQFREISVDREHSVIKFFK
ncbi:MAG: retropepsin-like aspartic protease [Saprospiraceae bacterium]